MGEFFNAILNFINYAVSIAPRLFEGLKMTASMTVCSLILGIVVGLISCFFSISKVKILNKLSGAYLSIIRGTPLMVQAMFIYFGITGALGFRISSFSASIIVLMLNAGAYLSEIFRSGIKAINKGQMEAARSLGLPHGVAMRKVILPQAFRIVIPSVTNQFIITLKDTSILSVIGVAELMRQSNQIVSGNFRGFETYAVVAVWYYVLVVILTKLFKLLERRLAN
ncbi:amino acid ABC transporter permease [Anaerotignum lactatifermentans]|uniref:Amino acid ABC transporter permease n=1 Tax=Anaerotignum lactatifermentans TaxID=160404 RepID=A0A1Y3U1T4_9FIRM|nr:amino acid ABC transporter permease [Anaerotignum lactatifermentans]OUN41037.1 amino acid ABC transporter permease [Anaerotignum lactatifermentans]